MAVIAGQRRVKAEERHAGRRFVGGISVQMKTNSMRSGEGWDGMGAAGQVVERK